MRVQDAERIETLTARCEAIADPDVRADVLELLRLVLDLHTAGLRIMLESALEAPHLEAAIAAWKRAPEVDLLIELHSLQQPLELAAARQRLRPMPDFVPAEALSGP